MTEKLKSGHWKKVQQFKVAGGQTNLTYNLYLEFFPNEARRFPPTLIVCFVANAADNFFWKGPL